MARSIAASITSGVVGMVENASHQDIEHFTEHLDGENRCVRRQRTDHLHDDVARDDIVHAFDRGKDAGVQRNPPWPSSYSSSRIQRPV